MHLVQKSGALAPVLLAATLAALAAATAGAHENHGAPSAASAAAAAASAPLTRRRDPQAYFTDRELFTQDGRAVRFYSDVLRGRTVVLHTIFTNCEDACPLITAQLAQVGRSLGAAVGKDVFFVAISSDPLRDTPQALKKYAAKHSADGPGWIYLTGKKADVDLILQKLGQWSPQIESHSTQLITWNFKADRGRKMLPNLPPDLLAAQIMNVAEGGTSNLLPGLGPARPN